MRVTVDFDSARGRRVVRCSAALLLGATLAWPVWLGASQVTGLVTFAPGETIRADDFNRNFQAIATALNDTDSRLTTLANTVTAPGGVQSQVTTLQSQASSQQAALQNQVAALQARVQALTIMGLPDTSIGLNGFASAPGTTMSPFGIVIDSQGRLVLAGLKPTGQAVVTRLNANGSLDATFGTSGFATATTPNGFGRGVAIDSTGRIVVGGSTTAPPLAAYVWRFNTDGSVDTTFGLGTGATSSVGAGAPDVSGQSVAIDSSGRILLAGQSGTAAATMTLWRFNADGTLDTSYASGTGFALDPIGNSAGVGLVLDSSGKALVCGHRGSGMAVWRFNTDGTPDTTFNGTGVYFDVGPPGQEFGNAITLDPSNRILVSGSASGNTVMSVWRLTPSGALDSTFGATGNGFVTSVGSGTTATSSGIAVDAVGKVYVAGLSGGPSQATLWRITQSGIFDPSFGAGKGYVQNTVFQLSTLLTYTALLALDSSGRPILGTTSSADLASVLRFD
jgi:uncharacterized delta-60 repeat protein